MEGYNSAFATAIMPSSEGDEPSQWVDHDHIVRVVTAPDFSTKISLWSTADFMDSVSQWKAERASEISLLTSFVAWQKNKLDYNAVYTAWLLGAMTEEEFEEEALKYAVELNDHDPHHVVEVADKLMRLLPFEPTTSELAEFLDTEPRNVLDSIVQLGQHSEKLRALLPVYRRRLPAE